MIKVGIICAGDEELRPFLPHIKSCKVSQKAMLNFYEGTICDVDIITLFSGVCKTNAATATQILIDTYGVNIIINSGTAGGMSNEVDIFDTVISTEIAHYDMDEGILTEFHPWMPSIYFKADDVLLNLSKKALKRINMKNKVFFGVMVTGEKFIDDSSRSEVNIALKPLSVDMETASIAQVCYVNKIPFISIRSITDNASHDGIDNFEKNCTLASEMSKNIVLELLTEISQGYR